MSLREKFFWKCLLTIISKFFEIFLLTRKWEHHGYAWLFFWVRLPRILSFFFECLRALALSLLTCSGESSIRGQRHFLLSFLVWKGPFSLSVSIEVNNTTKTILLSFFLTCYCQFSFGFGCQSQGGRGSCDHCDRAQSGHWVALFLVCVRFLIFARSIGEGMSALRSKISLP